MDGDNELLSAWHSTSVETKPHIMNENTQKKNDDESLGKRFASLLPRLMPDNTICTATTNDSDSDVILKEKIDNCTEQCQPVRNCIYSFELRSVSSFTEFVFQFALFSDEQTFVFVWLVASHYGKRGNSLWRKLTWTIDAGCQVSCQVCMG